MKSSNQTYGTMAVCIHWVSAILVIVLIGTGFRAGYAENLVAKASLLRIHLPVAALVLALTVWRLIWWWRFDYKPSEVEGLPAWQSFVARWTHRGLYLLIFVMLGSGIAMSVMSGLPNALFGTAPFPELAELPPRAVHGFAAVLIAAAVLLHAAAACYHHWVLKNRTLKRMLPRSR